MGKNDLIPSRAAVWVHICNSLRDFAFSSYLTFPRRLGSPTQSNTMSSNAPMTDYRLPTERLHRTLRDSSKQPIVLVACGSFSPVTYLHLRMFEMAVDYARQNTDFEIMGGYLSPVSDMYKKPGLLSASHRFVLTSSETLIILTLVIVLKV